MLAEPEALGRGEQVGGGRRTLRARPGVSVLCGAQGFTGGLASLLGCGSPRAAPTAACIFISRTAVPRAMTLPGQLRVPRRGAGLTAAFPVEADDRLGIQGLLDPEVAQGPTGSRAMTSFLGKPGRPLGTLRTGSPQVWTRHPTGPRASEAPLVRKSRIRFQPGTTFSLGPHTHGLFGGSLASVEGPELPQGPPWGAQEGVSGGGRQEGGSKPWAQEGLEGPGLGGQAAWPSAMSLAFPGALSSPQEGLCPNLIITPSLAPAASYF